MNPVAVILRAVQLVRGWGIVVTFEPGWETRGNGYLSRWVGILIHHTATPSSLSNPFPTRSVLRDGRPGLSGPLCNSAGPADGSVHVMAAQAANHAGASGGRSMGPLPTVNLFNPLVFGHEIDYAGTVPMLSGQYWAAVLWSRAILTALQEAGQIPTVDPQRARAHAETSVTGKWDAGDAPGRTIDMPAFRAAVLQPPPTPGPSADPFEGVDPVAILPASPEYTETVVPNPFVGPTKVKMWIGSGWGARVEGLVYANDDAGNRQPTLNPGTLNVTPDNPDYFILDAGMVIVPIRYKSDKPVAVTFARV